MQIRTRNNQFGYKEGISTTDATIRIEQYIEHANRGDKILLMDLSNAFGAINRTLLWTTLYKKGLGRNGKTHSQRASWENYRHNVRGGYGEPRGNNIEVFHGSAISALLFIIYMDDAMED